MKDLWVGFLFIVLSSPSSFAQNGSIVGKVYDKTDDAIGFAKIIENHIIYLHVTEFYLTMNLLEEVKLLLQKK